VRDGSGFNQGNFPTALITTTRLSSYPHKPAASVHLTHIPSPKQQTVIQLCALSAHLSAASASACAPRPSETQTRALSPNTRHVAKLQSVRRKPLQPGRGWLRAVEPIWRWRLCVEPLRRRRSKRCQRANATGLTATDTICSMTSNRMHRRSSTTTRPTRSPRSTPEPAPSRPAPPTPTRTFLTPTCLSSKHTVRRRPSSMARNH
jgi:hypothetical protein